MKKIILLFIIIFMVSCQAKYNEVTKENITDYPVLFREYMVNVWNCSLGDEFSDVIIPDELKEKFTDEALYNFFYKCYEKVWIEYEEQTDSSQYSWYSDRSTYAGEYVYSVEVELTNVSSFPIKDVILLINASHRYKLTTSSVIYPYKFGKLKCKIPYSLYNDIKTNGGKARIEGIYYR